MMHGVVQQVRVDENVKASRKTEGGMFVAQSIKPQARTLADSRSIACVEMDYDELQGKNPTTGRCLTIEFGPLKMWRRQCRRTIHHHLTHHHE